MVNKKIVSQANNQTPSVEEFDLTSEIITPKEIRNSRTNAEAPRKTICAGSNTKVTVGFNLKLNGKK